jgi:hypothetical protein
MFKPSLYASTHPLVYSISSCLLRNVEFRRPVTGRHYYLPQMKDECSPLKLFLMTLSVRNSDFIVTSYLTEKLSKLRSFDKQ